MKHILFAILIYLLNFQNVALGKNEGTGPLILSDAAVNYFMQYIKAKRGAPEILIFSQDSGWATYYTCPVAGECQGAGEAKKEIRRCERESREATGRDIQCGLFAKGRKVVWKNGINRADKNSRFKRKMEYSDFTEKLTKLGFYGDVQISADDKKDVTSKLQELKELYDSGALSKDQFEKAKKKLLN